MPTHDNAVADIIDSLGLIEQRLLKKQAIDIHEIRDAMNHAASLLCRSTIDQADVITHFVRIPFVNFTKPSVKLGLSLWMGVIKENPRLESRLLVEIVEGWITTVRRKVGIFSRKLRYWCFSSFDSRY